MKDKPKKQAYNLRMDPDLYEKAMNLANSRYQSLNGMVLHLLKMEIEKEEAKQSPEQ